MNNDFPDDGGPHNNKCTGLSAFMAISNSAFTSLKLFDANFSITFSPSTKENHYFLFSPFLSHYSLIRRTLKCSDISCKKIVFIQPLLSLHKAYGKTR
jgi:hypothetical protein